MRPLIASHLADELRAIQLDPMNLPPFAEVSPWQRRRLMSTFTRSLGIGCTGCHDAGDYRIRTKEMSITVQMWNDFARPNALKTGTLYCDSCHQGQDRYLDRQDSTALRRYMDESFTGQLVQHGSKAIQCDTCHGEPFDVKILARQ